MSKPPEHEACPWKAAAGVTLTLPKLWPVVPTHDLTWSKGNRSVRTKLNEHHSGNCNWWLSSKTQSSNLCVCVFSANIARGFLEPLSINKKKSTVKKKSTQYELILFSKGLYVQAHFVQASECFLKWGRSHPLAIKHARAKVAHLELCARASPWALRSFPFVPLQSCATRHYSVVNMGKTNGVQDRYACQHWLAQGAEFLCGGVNTSLQSAHFYKRLVLKRQPQQ